MKSFLSHMFRLIGPPTCIASLLLLMLTQTGCEEGPPTVPLDQLVGSSPLKSPPLLVTGSTAQRFLAAFHKTLYVWNFEGQRLNEPQPLPFSVKKIFSMNTGAVAVGREGIIPIDMTGTTQTPLEFEHDNERIYWTATMGKEGILVASTGLHDDLTVQVYQLDGHQFGPPTHLVRPKLGTVLAASRLGDGNFVLVWEEDRSLYARMFSNEGHPLQAPFLLYAAGKCGALQRGSAQRREDGSVLVAWQDSSPGPWSVMTLIINPDCTVESIGRVNPYDETDATRVSIPNGGDGRVVAWISGIHWGKFAVSGQGGVLLQKVDAQSPAFRCEASGSIQSFSVIMRGTRTFVLGAVRQASAEDETLGYQVYAGLASFPQ